MNVSQARNPQGLARLNAQRQRVLRGAAKVFSRLGFHAATMDDIAVEVRATRGLVYYHFRSKAEIFYELHMAALGELIDRFHRRVDPVRGPVDRLRQAVQAHAEFSCKRLTLAGVTSRMMEVQRARDFPRRYREAIIARRDEYERLFQAILEDGVRQGLFRDTDVPVAVKTMLGALNWLCFWYRPRGRLSASELTQLISDNIVHGLVVTTKETATGPSSVKRMALPHDESGRP